MGMAQKPKLLILDEPTQGLSDSEIENTFAIITLTSSSIIPIQSPSDLVTLYHYLVYRPRIDLVL